MTQHQQIQALKLAYWTQLKKYSFPKKAQLWKKYTPYGFAFVGMWMLSWLVFQTIFNVLGLI